MNGNSAIRARRQKASELELLLAWQEGGSELRREFRDDFSHFCYWADKEARRLLNSVSEGGADA
jgi:hypothetical protein